jgi:hypothetical protein
MSPPLRFPRFSGLKPVFPEHRKTIQKPIWNMFAIFRVFINTTSHDRWEPGGRLHHGDSPGATALALTRT